jgi:hypothetical protein
MKCEIRLINGQKYLFVSRNGHQWTSVPVSYRDMFTIKEVLSQELDKNMRRIMRDTFMRSAND